MCPNRTLYEWLTLISPLRAQPGTLRGYSPEADGQCEGLKISGGDRNRNLFVGAEERRMRERNNTLLQDEERENQERENCLQPSNGCNLLTMLRGKGKKNIQQANTKERGGPQWEANTIKELQKKKNTAHQKCTQALRRQPKTTEFNL